MKILRVWFARLAGMFSRKQRESELADELNSHLQMAVEDNLRSGMTAEEARRAAMLQLGGEPTRQAYRERGTLPGMENVFQDLRFALRQLRKNPGFTVTAVLMLVLGISASVSIFAFVDAALIKPLPYTNPSRVMGVYETNPLCPKCNLSYQDYLDWKKMNTVFSSLEGWGFNGYLLKAPEGTEPVSGVRVSDGFFRTLGVKPALGRDFYAGEDSPESPRTVLLSDTIWRQKFGGKADAVGQTLVLNDETYTIIGILPAEFHFAPRGKGDFWTTFHDLNSCDKRRSCHGMYGVARLKDGVSVKTAAAEMVGIAAQLEKEYPGSNHGQGAAIMPLSEAIIGDIRPLLLMLMCGAALLLLIACVNVSSLLLVRSENRRREIAVRGALGASPRRLVGQFVIEGLVLVTMGSAAGVALSYVAMGLLLRLIPEKMMASMPYLAGLGLNGRVIAFAVVVSLLAAGLFAVIPMVRMPFTKMQAGLTDGGRGTAGTVWRRLGTNLVVLELAIAMVGLPWHGEHNDSLEREVSTDYFRTLKATLLEGRYFTDADDESKLKKVIINKTLADRFFPGVNPVGRMIADLDLTPKTMKEVIGVVNDVKEGALDQERWPAIYFAFNQGPDLSYGVVVRTSQDAGAALPMITATIREVNPGIGVWDEMTMTGKIENSPAAYLHRSSAWLVGGFAAVALVLSVMGLYGVIAYSVSQRTREIGVRMALGAQRGSVYRLILREAGWLIGAGVVVGLGCSLAAGTMMRTLLFGVRAWDVPTLAAVALVLGVFALMASYVPARRAASVNPVEALRAE
jgi:hypothetical protein